MRKSPHIYAEVKKLKGPGKLGVGCRCSGEGIDSSTSWSTMGAESALRLRNLEGKKLNIADIL